MLNLFVDAGGVDQRPNDWRVWMVLFRDARGNTVKVSQKYIAERLSVDRKTVGRAIRRLRDAGLVKLVRQGGFRRGSSIYQISSCPSTSETGGRH